MHLREWAGRSTTTKYSEGQDENHDLCSTVERRRSDVVVLDKQLWTLPSEIPLREEAEEEEHADGRVDTNEQITHLPEDDGQVDVSERGMRIELICKPHWDWDEEPDYVGDRDPLVFGAN